MLKNDPLWGLGFPETVQEVVMGLLPGDGASELCSSPGPELEDCNKSTKKLDAMTLIKEGGHCTQ